MHLQSLMLPLLASSTLVLMACTKTPVSDTGRGPEAITEWHCGQQVIATEFVGEQLRLTVGEEHYILEPMISASGARYQSADAEEASLWFKGWEASLQLQGRDYPLCVPPNGVVEPFRASGNEPFWSVNLNEGLLTFSRLGQEPIQALPYLREDADGPITAGAGDQAISLQLRDGLCRDTMSGMPFPQHVELEIAGETLKGCGGEPARLLQGVEWVVEDINGQGIIDNSRVTLNFETDGRINGLASCNRFMGQYQLTGENLTLSQTATTRMACAPALMEQEARLLKNLESLQSFDFSEESAALILRSREGSLKALPESR